MGWIFFAKSAPERVADEPCGEGVETAAALAAAALAPAAAAAAAAACAFLCLGGMKMMEEQRQHSQFIEKL
jgi:hypothetical protein